MRFRYAPRRLTVLALTLLGSFAPLHCASGGAGGTAARGNVTLAATYNSRIDRSYAPPQSTANFYTAARAGGAQAGHELSPDAALGATAQAIAERVATDSNQRTPAARVIQALAWNAGLIDPIPAVVVSRVAGNAPLTPLTASVSEMVHEGSFNVVGIGDAPARDGSRIVVIAVSQRRLTLRAPVPRRVARGAHVHVAGTLSAGLHDPEVAITHPDGHNEHFPLGEGPDFDGQFPATQRGAYQVELLAEGQGGSTVIANFPLYVDVDPPATPDTVASTASEPPTQIETTLLALLNEARRAAHRAPVTPLPNLSTIARAHSADMAQNHFVAHNSATTGTPSDRLHRAGLQSGTVLENLGRGYNAREIHDGLMASPGHRANILNERVTHVGIGAAAERGADSAVLVTEDFIEVAQAIDLNAAPATILTHINDARVRRGARPLTERPQLTEVARTTAQDFFHGTASQQQVVDRANRQINRFGLIFRRVAVVATVVPNLQDAFALEPLMEPEIGAVGIGVSQGSRPDTPPNAVFVVFVLGYPR